MSYYTVLDLPTDCTLEEIKKSYKQLAKIFHPDKNQSDGGAKFKSISEAYKTLSDSEKRAEYDERIGISRKRPHGDVVDFDDFETDSEDEELISFRCRCSGKYFIERTDGEHLPLEVPCSDCSLFIYVDNT